MGCRRHDRLQLPQRSQRPLHQPVESRRMRRVYAKLTGRTELFDDVLYWSKRLIMETAMASELSVLAHELERIAESNRRSRDFTLEALKDAITRSSPVSPCIAPTSTCAAGLPRIAPSSNRRSSAPGVEIRRWSRLCSTSCARSSCRASLTRRMRIASTSDVMAIRPPMPTNQRAACTSR